MRDITRDEIRRAFGEKTFARGLEYFENGYVETGVKRGNKLIGTVLGSAPNPYKVRVEIADEIHSECTCPVGEMCKHGVALILQWMKERGSFLDADHLLASLARRDKKELIKIISTIIEEEPVLASKLALSGEVSEKRVNIEAISRRISHILGGFLDYYAVPGVVSELEEVKRMGDRLAEAGSYKEAVDVYLLLIKSGVDAFENGVDDSDGILGDFVMECVEDFKMNVEKLGEEQKRALIYEIMEIIEVEDYGLDTDEMLFGMATKENIAVIEDELLRMIPESGESFHVEYHRRRILDLISELYEYLGLHGDALRVMIKAGLKNKDDYLRLARALMTEGKDKEAFEYVRAGVRLEEGRNYALDKLYFKLLNQFLGEKREVEVKEEEAVNTAISLLSYHFESETYELIKGVFEKIGRYEELISAIKTRCEESVAISVLLHDAHLDDAIERAIASTTLHPEMIIEVAEAANERGKKEEAMKLTLKALKQGFISVDESVSELIKLLVKGSNERELKEAIGCVKTVSVAEVFVDALLERSQEYAVRVLERFITEMGKEEIKGYANRLDGEYAMQVCHSWVSKAVNRSHVYYDDAIDILKTMRGIAGEEEWRRYIQAFVEANKGKKKLMEKIRGVKLV
ncbi:MAG: SWIM zinc finger family protein [Candidatus Methanospirareceae archaeon]